MPTQWHHSLPHYHMTREPQLLCRNDMVHEELKHTGKALVHQKRMEEAPINQLNTKQEPRESGQPIGISVLDFQWTNACNSLSVTHKWWSNNVLEGFWYKERDIRVQPTCG